MSEEETSDQLQSVSLEHGATEDVSVQLESPAAKQFPASWTFTQLSTVDQEVLGEVVSERVPSPKNTSELEVTSCELQQSSSHVEPSHTTHVMIEYPSDEEEDDLFLDVPEPSVLPRPTDAYELGRVSIVGRKLMLTLLQRVLDETETTYEGRTEYSVESSVAVDEVPRLCGLAVKALPTPTRAALQNAVCALQTVDEVSEKRPATEVTLCHFTHSLIRSGTKLFIFAFNVL